jgi:hypothetical protein
MLQNKKAEPVGSAFLCRGGSPEVSGEPATILIHLILKDNNNCLVENLLLLTISENKKAEPTGSAFLCRGGRIRTCDLRVPNAAR